MNENFMKRAIEIAQQNVTNVIGGPFGCVIVKDNKIISEGVNLVTNNNDPTAHAEIVAIRKACDNLNTFKLNGSELYTTCYPCPMCIAAIYWAHIDKFYYSGTKEDAKRAGFDDEFIHNEFSKKIEDRKLPAEPLMSNESQKIFEIWINSKDKIPY